MTDDEFTLNRWSSIKFIAWLKGTSPEFSTVSFNYPENWYGEYLETLSPKDLALMGITNDAMQKKAIEIVDNLLEQYHALETENLQSVMLRVQTQATCLREVILKRNQLQELLERAFQTKPSQLLDIDAGSEEVLKRKMIAFVDVVQRDIRKLEDQYMPLCFQLNKSVQHAMHWLKCTPFSASPTIPIDKNKLQSASQEVKISLERCQDKNNTSTVNLVTARNQLEMIISLCKDFIEKCRDSLYITPYRLERFYLQKDRAHTFGLELSTAPNGAVYISAVHKRSPAGSRISEGDEILEVNDKVVIAWDVESVKQLIDECQHDIRLFLRRRPMHTNEVLGGYNQVRPIKFGMTGGKFQPSGPIAGVLQEVEPGGSPQLERLTRGPLRPDRHYKLKQSMSPISAAGAQSVPVTPLLQVRSPHCQESREPSPSRTVANDPPTPVPPSGSTFEEGRYIPLPGHSDDGFVEVNKSGLSHQKSSNSFASSTSGNSLLPDECKLGNSIDDIDLGAYAPHVESETYDSSDVDEHIEHSHIAKNRSRSAGQASDSSAKCQSNTLPEIRQHRNVSASEKGKLDRRISCKDLGKGECAGWLWVKKSNSLTSVWVLRYCVLKRNQFYYYHNQNDLRAEGLLYIPGFVVTPLIELKNGKYAFRLYNDYVSFILASVSNQDRAKWMNKLGLVAIGVRLSSGEQIAGFHGPFSTNSRPTGLIESGASPTDCQAGTLRREMPGMGHTNVIYQFERRQRLDQQEALKRALADKQQQQQIQQQPQQVELFSESDEEADDASTTGPRRTMPLRAASKADSSQSSASSSRDNLHSNSEENEKLENIITLLDQYESLSKHLIEKETLLCELEKSLSEIDS